MTTPIKNMRVLLAEANEEIVSQICIYLRDMGHEVIQITNNGRTLVELTRDLFPDIVIINSELPPLSGITTAEIIQRESPVPIIMLTHKKSYEMLEEIIKKGIGWALTLPVQYEELEKAFHIAPVRHESIRKSRKLIELLEEKNYLLEVTQQQLREEIASKNSFFSILSHDLKAPFQTLITFTNMLVEDYNEIPCNEMLRYLKSLSIVSQNTYSLLENLLDWSRLQRNNLLPDFEEINIPGLVDKALRIFDLNIKSKQLEVDISELPATLTARADRNMVFTVMRNLLSNAIKFSYPEGVIKIAGLPTDSNSIAVTFADKGTGMTPTEIENLFSSTIKSRKGTDNEPGTGLGLLLCKELVELNNGKFVVNSKQGEGSEFKFTLNR